MVLAQVLHELPGMIMRLPVIVRIPKTTITVMIKFVEKINLLEILFKLLLQLAVNTLCFSALFNNRWQRVKISNLILETIDVFAFWFQIITCLLVLLNRIRHRP